MIGVLTRSVDQSGLQAQGGVLTWHQAQAIISPGRRFNPQKTHGLLAPEAE
jgi:hypothetical protein